MPRTARASVGGVCYHVTNRGNARGAVFHSDDDFQAFVELLSAACNRLPMRVLAYCLMPNHFHLAIWPHKNGDLSRWVQWLLTSHVRLYHRRYESSGHVWQGRFKAFPIQQDEHLLTVMRYIERNPLRARLVRRAEYWRWSSLQWWKKNERPKFLHEGPMERGNDWLQVVHEPSTDAELARLRQSVHRGTPFGNEPWVKRIAVRLGLESTLRPQGRPRKAVKK
jgi:putative transposase